ncbi:MAG: hypothetical protein QOH75_3013 [Actinomycetota bacterium]|nr:hypothetical protein [Actinomycetota bacterium]
MEDGAGTPLDVLDIGRRLREHRAARQLSLDTVAKSCGISPSLLSQVERGKVTPSLSTLHGISQALNIPMFELFGSPADHLSLIRARERNVIRPPDAGGVAYELLSSSHLRHLQMIEMRLGKDGGTFDHALSHAGEECVVVLEGRAVVQVDDERVELEIGDSVSFMARRPHSFGGLDGEPARLIVSMTPPAF